MLSAYYNEHDAAAAAWLRELIKARQIAPGEVDERSITDVSPDDLRGFTQCHWFAGIGGWSLALRLAGWPDGEHCWSGSCPCTPFSVAGKGQGFDDERHLWPVWFRPGLGWFDLVSTDMEAEGYACGAVDISAAGVGAPHIRQRLFWVADAEHAERRPRDAGGYDGDGQNAERSQGAGVLGECGDAGGMGDTGAPGLPAREREAGAGAWTGDEGRTVAEPGEAPGWSDALWIPCRDGKLRAIQGATQPGAEPLATGLSDSLGRCRVGGVEVYAPLIEKGEARTMRLRGYGNAIVPAVAAEFIRAYREVRP